MTRPNILWLQSDQHNPGFLGCAGEPLVRTPRLDALAAAGVRCADVTCGNPLCVPSRMTMLTARHSSDIAVWTNECQLAGGAATFVHHLANAGYQTVLCGRMHFTGPDQRRGYESRILGDVDPKLESIPAATTGQTAAGVRPAGPGRTAYGAFDEAVTATACRWL
ncbi:MAG: sulfatase-like hydrolase/transferase, partial [Armatimonadetes bacterium]|nr:sulfatase-like hydrolase/transferase [Armatimonadota bacterium]